MASGNERGPGTPSGGRDDPVPTPSAQFFASSAFDLDLDYVVAASLGGGVSPDSDQEPDPPEVAAVVKDIFRLDATQLISNTSLGSPAAVVVTGLSDDASTDDTPSLPTPSPPNPSSSQQQQQPILQPPEKPLRMANISKKLDDYLKDAAGQDSAEAASSSSSSSFGVSSPLSSSGETNPSLTNASSSHEKIEGRLGPKKVAFDPNSKVGNVILDSDHLGVTSQSNFSTVRANSCVYKGKWVYELMLGSKGVMQVGWCTLDCKFSGEEGVGDTPTSYAYDGNRLRKWNVSMSKYGEPWLTGDVISCAIDCDEGTITFCHNGKNMGRAFDNVRLGPGIAYFPALSLSFNENVRVNFGATPLRFPMAGFSPLQPPPGPDLRKARLLTTFVENLVDAYSRALIEERDEVWKTRSRDGERADIVNAATGGIPTAIKTTKLSQKAVCILSAWHIFEKLSPFLKSPFITESCLVKLLMTVSDLSGPRMPQGRLHTLLDLMWMVMDPQEVESTFENILISLLTAYRFSPTNDEFRNQHLYLLLTHAILTHERTRKFLLKKVLFDKIKFPIFMHVKPPDDATLTGMVPTVWWAPSPGNKESSPFAANYEPKDEEEKWRKAEYEAAIERLKAKIKVLEDTQTDILITLLTDADADSQQGSGVSSQYIFLYKLREFLRENLAGSRLLQFQLCPLPVILCFFHRLIASLKTLWDEDSNALSSGADYSSSSSSVGAAASSDLPSPSAGAQAPSSSSQRLPFDEAFVPLEKFFDDSIQFFDSQRLGGLESHLKKTLKAEIQAARGSVTPVGLTSNFPLLLAKLLKQDIQGDGRMATGSGGGSGRGDESKSSDSSAKKKDQSCGSKYKMRDPLIELIDDIVLMYHVGAHKQLRKMSTLRENMQGYIQNLEETECKIANCPSGAHEVQMELRRAQKVFEEKVCEQARHMAWVSAVVYFDERQRDVCWLMNTMLRTFEKSGSTTGNNKDDGADDANAGSSTDGGASTGAANPLFAFIPDYYVEVIINAYYSLKNFFHPTVPYTNCFRWKELLVRFAEFLSDNFRDSRIVHSDSRDSLIQALACFVCYPHSLEALESMPKWKRTLMTSHLISPYENRSWAQTNWILVRLWKGCGFGFRYTQLPHYAGRKESPPDIASAGMQKPCPSSVFQNQVKELLDHDESKAVGFLNSILNQLNWAFSEFIGMLQEIQQIAGRPERNYVDSRQLKIAATCFDLTVGLLRVLEMIVHLCPQLFLAWDSNSSSEALLRRLCQLICQLLSRITTKTSLFDTVVAFDLPGMESVDHYPILTAVTGILVELISRGSPASRELTTRVILDDPSFQISSIEYLLEEESAESTAGDSATGCSANTVKSPTFTAPNVSDMQGAIPKRNDALSFRSPLDALDKKRKFSFHNFPEHIAPSEIQETEFLVQHLTSQMPDEANPECSSPDDENLCPICCSNVINVEFKPCKHRSCKACITHHLMNNKECFFCKVPISGFEIILCTSVDDHYDVIGL